MAVAFFLVQQGEKYTLSLRQRDPASRGTEHCTCTAEARGGGHLHYPQSATRIGDKELSVAPQGIRFATHFTGDIVGFLGKNAAFEIVMIDGVGE